MEELYVERLAGVTSGAVYQELGEAAWSWVLRCVRDDDGPWLPEIVADDTEPEGPDRDRDSLYAGIAGLAPVLAEITRARPLDDQEQTLATGIVARLTATARTRTEPSLYGGLGADVTALRLLAPGADQVPLDRLHSLMTPAGWTSTLELQPGPPMQVTDLLAGTAGVVLAAVWAGGKHAREIAATGGDALLRVAEPVGAGLDWAMIPGQAGKMPNYSHGTAGVAAALAIAGHALDRPDFVAAARRGAEHLLAVGFLDEEGFVVPHTIPPSTRDVEAVTYTWCHGPAGTSQLFAALALAGVDEIAGFRTAQLRQRCLHSILVSGVPRRIRPGFWDNDGRCCGTAGVGDVLLDAAQDSPDDKRADVLVEAAKVMADALLERAIRDERGARWRFLEHRRNPPLLPPGTSWMQGAAGIAAFLMRTARVIDHGRNAPIVDRPDQWWAVPHRLRTVHTGRSPGGEA